MFKAITEKSQDNRGLRNPMSVSSIKSIAGCTGEELYEVIEKFQSFFTMLYYSPEGYSP